MPLQLVVRVADVIRPGLICIIIRESVLNLDHSVNVWAKVT